MIKLANLCSRPTRLVTTTSTNRRTTSRDPAADLRRLQALAVGQPVDVDDPRRGSPLTG
jgi:hypothetical protein